MKAVCLKKAGNQNTSLFVSKKEIEEMRNYFNELLDNSKDTVSHNSEDYMLVVTKGVEDKFTLTIECPLAN